MEIIAILLGGILINNLVFAQFLGLCPFVGVSKQVETATGMSAAVVFVMTMAAAVTAALNTLVLRPYGLQYLETVTFILVIASLVQFVETFLRKASPVLHRALGIYLPLITTNCAVLGAALISVRKGYSIGLSAVNGLAGSLGWSLAIILFAGIRERLELADIPESLKGFPVALISTGLMAIAFLGFQGLFRFVFQR
ncbi:MAG: RnfABCDGE type electron transport complex subunit A [Bacillota bacterium]